MSEANPHQSDDACDRSEREREWKVFRDQADRNWTPELAEEERICREVLPTKAIPFPSCIQYPEIIIDRDVPVPMRDGVVLKADVYRPKAEGKFPVTINRGPYDKTSSLDDTPAVARNLAQRGYVCIAQDTRGRYASEGDYEPLSTEIEDGVDTVEWAAAQPWSTKKVGMFGVSYNGFVQLSAAIGQAPNLSCIYPGMIGYGVQPRKNGIPWLATFVAWYIWAGQGRECLNPMRIDAWHLPLNEIDDKSGYPNPVVDALVTMDLDNPLPGEIAEDLVADRLASIRTPTYCVAGWYDELVYSTLETWQQIRETQPDAKLIIGPWHHNLCDLDEPRIGKVETDDIELKRYFEQMELFFAHHLKGEENELSRADAPIKIYVMGKRTWRDEYEWPLARTVYKSLYLHSSGAAATNLENGVLDWQQPEGEQPADEYDYDPLDPVKWSKDVEIWSYLLEMGDRRDIEDRRDVLVYTTPVLEKDIEVTGYAKAVLFAASNCEDTDFVVNLVDVHSDEHTQYLTHGIVRARYRDGVENPRLIEPGKVYEYEIELWPTSNVFLAGHRIRVEITSSDFDRYARNQNIAAPPGQTSKTRIAHQSVFHDEFHLSRLVIPVIPRGEAS
jgi:hypothetical protein